MKNSRSAIPYGGTEMLENSFLNPNKIWFMIVLLHIIGSVLVSLLGIFPFGIVIATTGIWFLLANIWERNLKNIGICIAGWFITIFTMHSLNISFQGTVLLNEILLLYVCWCCKKAYVKPTEYCHLKKVSLKSTFFIVIAAIVLFVMAGYVNACSMIVFQNLLDVSLKEISGHPLEAMIAVAIMPALIEEVLFRGIIYRGISDKKIAIFISAITFALLHMNFNQMCYAFVMGLFFAVVIYITDNLTVSIALHMLFNAFTVILCCFPSTKVIRTLLEYNIAGYHLFNPGVTNMQGGIEISLVLIGGVIAVVSMLIAGYLVFLIGKEGKVEKKVYKAKEKKETRMQTAKRMVIPANSEKWKPNALFFAGSGLCILITILYEILI